MTQKPTIRGGEFLIKETDFQDVFIPEEFDEEQSMIAETCNDFVETEIAPHFEALDNHEEGLMPSLLKKAGELGLLGISIPEDYAGFGQGFLTNMRANEAMGSAYSFSVAFMAHTGIGSLPLAYYGNDEQKEEVKTLFGNQPGENITKDPSESPPPSKKDNQENKDPFKKTIKEE